MRSSVGASAPFHLRVDPAGPPGWFPSGRAAGFSARDVGLFAGVKPFLAAMMLVHQDSGQPSATTIAGVMTNARIQYSFVIADP
jgi:hypothetical protein